MNCSMLGTQMNAYLSGRLSETEATAIERHAAECDRCGPMLEERTRLDVALPLELTPPPLHRERVMAYVTARKPSRGLRWWVPAAMAAGLLLALGLMRPPMKSGQGREVPGLPAEMAAARADGEFQRLDAARAELRAAIAGSPDDPMLTRALERLDAQRKSMENLIREFET